MQIRFEFKQGYGEVTERNCMMRGKSDLKRVTLGLEDYRQMLKLGFKPHESRLLYWLLNLIQWVHETHDYIPSLNTNDNAMYCLQRSKG